MTCRAARLEDDDFEVDAKQLGRPDGHHPSAYGWEEGCVLCALCHIQVAESVFFISPCTARVKESSETQNPHA